MLPSAFALSLPSLFSTYNQFSGWLDFLIFFLIFFSLPKMVFKKHFEGEESGAFNALCLGIGLVLSFAMIGLEYYLGINLLNFGPLALLILALALLLPLINLFKGKDEEGGSNKWLALAIILLIILLAIWFLYPELLTYISYGDDLLWFLIILLSIILAIFLLKWLGKHLKWPEWKKGEKGETPEGLDPYKKKNDGKTKKPFEDTDLVDKGKKRKDTIPSGDIPPEALGFKKLKVDIEFKPSSSAFADNEDFVAVSKVGGGSGNYTYEWSLPGLTGVFSDKPYVQLNGSTFPLPSSKNKEKFTIELVVRDAVTGAVQKAVKTFTINRTNTFGSDSIGIVVQDMIDGRPLAEGSRFIQLRDPAFVASHRGDLLISVAISGGYVPGEHDITWDIGVPLGSREKVESFIFSSGDWGFGKGWFGKTKLEEDKIIKVKVKFKGGAVANKTFRLRLLRKEHTDHVKIKIDRPLSQDFSIGEDFEVSARIERDDYNVVDSIVWYYREGQVQTFVKKDSKPIIVSGRHLETQTGNVETVRLPVTKDGLYMIYAVAKGTSGDLIETDFDKVSVGFFNNRFEIIKPKPLSNHLSHNLLELECDFRDMTGKVDKLLWALYDSTGTTIVTVSGRRIIALDNLSTTVSSPAGYFSSRPRIKKAVAQKFDINGVAPGDYIVSLSAHDVTSRRLNDKRVRIKIGIPRAPVLTIVKPELHKRITEGFMPGESMFYQVKVVDPDKVCNADLFEWQIIGSMGIPLPGNVFAMNSTISNSFTLPNTMAIGKYKLRVTAVSPLAPYGSYTTGGIDRKYILTSIAEEDFEVKMRRVSFWGRIKWP